jgi:hypothetical protein
VRCVNERLGDHEDRAEVYDAQVDDLSLIG